LESALSLLKEGEICIVVTKDGDREAIWSAQRWCFYYLNRGAPIVYRADEIEEWRPASIRM
jgi:hypothetical protein